MAVSSDSQFVAHPNGASIGLYDVTDGKLRSTLRGHYDNVNCCIVHPWWPVRRSLLWGAHTLRPERMQTQTIFSGSDDQAILVWNAERSVADIGEVEDGEVGSVQCPFATPKRSATPG